MIRNRALRVKDGETLSTQDDTWPTTQTLGDSFMLNHCRECRRYTWVYLQVDLGDGKGPGYVCGRCRREARERR